MLSFAHAVAQRAGTETKALGGLSVPRGVPATALPHTGEVAPVVEPAVGRGCDLFGHHRSRFRRPPFIQGKGDTMKRMAAFAAFGLALAFTAPTGSAQEKLDRTVLPIQEPKRATYTELDARRAKPPARFAVKAPRGAPNVVIVLIDDIGFGGPSTFGGPIRTPTMDQLAQGGLRFNNFHTTALCSPTRVALKSGRNHHTANAGSIMETATAFPGNTGQIPNSVAPLAGIRRLNGYSAGAFGKWHETAAWETSVSGPFDRWPTHQGFDKFYGFIGGETDQGYPLIYDGVIKGETAKKGH